VIFRQLVHDDLGCASYLIGDVDAGVAAVVDPKLDIGEYLRLARFLGVHIEHVLETHNHADHVSGHGRLAAATGATIHVHREAAAEYDHEPFDDGWELRLGDVTVWAIHTPGHRPEHSAFALIAAGRSSEPWAVLTGDSLFVGDIARPDLAVDKAEGARGIFRSLNERLLSLPDTCEIWPGHLGGSMCGGPGMDLKVSSTIGFERANQPLLQISDEDDFVRRATAGLGPQPPNFQNIVALNRGALLIDTAEAHPLTPRQVRQAERDGALVVDVRTELQFDEAHIPAAVCITALRGGFGSRLAWLARPEQPLVLVGRDDEDACEAAELAGAVGLSNVAGYLAGGMTSWREEKQPVERVERLTLGELHDRWEGDRDAIQLVDVRERAEWDAGHIPESFHLPYHDIRELPEGLDPDRPIAAICASGQRAAVGASLLKRLGAEDVIHVVDGGVPRWQREGWPVER
jgi:rhodanese-related sulfurtransferase/glyoxylase-like metal-dependent hydrolase (beta-lactamase superfamily II)